MIGVALVMLERRRGRGGVPSGSLSAPPSLPRARWRLKMKGRARARTSNAQDGTQHRRLTPLLAMQPVCRPSPPTVSRRACSSLYRI